MNQSMTRFKPSGIEWLGEVPEHWKVCKIKRLSPVKRGASPRPIDDLKYFDDNGEFSWVRISDVTASKKYLTQTTEKLSALGSSLSVKLDPDTFFVSIAASVGKPAITKIKCCIHDGFVYLPYLKINPDFLYYLFEGGQLFQGLGKLGTQLNLNTETIGSIHIPIPPKNEIKLITDYIDRETTEIDALIVEKEDMLALLEEKREVLISHTVTHGINPNVPFKFSGIDSLGDIPQHWKIERLKFIAEVQTGVTLGKKYQNEELIICPYLRVANVQDGFLDLNFITEISMPKKDVSRYQLEYGDVLMTEGGDFDKLGRGYVWEGQIENCLHQNHIFAVRPFAKYLDSYFLAVLMRSHYGKAYFISTSKQTTNLATTNQTNLLNFYLPVPPIEEQKLIVDYLNFEIEKADELLAAIKDSISLLKERRSALITAAVTGQIEIKEI